MARARILAVDDERYFRTFLEDLLSAEGYAVATAGSAEEALHLLERERFDVVLTDLVMVGSSGVEFVERIKESWPDQDVVVVTSVGDVRTAVDAMRRGATDYVLKPTDRTELTRSLEAILQRRRLRHERGRLLAENIEVLATLSVHERALGFLSTLSLEPLADRIIEGLCLETRAQGGVLWLARPEDPDRLRLVAARGLVRPEHESEEVDLERLPQGLEALGDAQASPFCSDAPDDASGDGATLYVPLRHAGLLLGFARLTDKLAGAAFDARDRAVAERLAEPAAIAAANARRHRALEKRTFRDPTTKAYTWAYFEDVLRNEIEKAGRFARGFSIVRVELLGLATLRKELPDAALARWLETLVSRVVTLLRASDLVAQESESQYVLLLPETDAIGAAVLKRRLRDALTRAELLRPAKEREPAGLALASASYPVDGTQPEALERVLAERLAADRSSLLERFGLPGRSFASALEALACEGRTLHADALEQIFRFVLDEADRRACERGLLCVAPGSARTALVRDALVRFDPAITRTELVLVSEESFDALAGAPVTCVSPRRAKTQRPFLIYYAEGPCYALVADPDATGPEVQVFHESDRALVEQLAFQLQRDLGIPMGR